MDWDDEFNTVIGRLDWILSKMVLYSKQGDIVSEANRQTLKHHAEDMILAGNSILKRLNPEAAEKSNG